MGRASAPSTRWLRISEKTRSHRAMNLKTLRYVAFLLVGVFVATALLSGCGNKGPLYLPDSAQQPADDTNKKKSKK